MANEEVPLDLTSVAAEPVNWEQERIAAYNELNQFELIGDDAANGTTTHVDAIAAIKAQYPKP